MDLTLLTDKGRDRMVRYRIIIRDKVDAPRWGLCWLYGKVCRLVPVLRWDDRVTTIGRTVWVTRRWRESDPVSQAVTMEHEAHHVHQSRAWFGWYWLSYVLVLPIGLSMRGVWEASAFLRGYRVRLNFDGVSGLIGAEDRLTDHVCGPAYFYALWLIRPIARRIIARKLRGIIDGKG